MISTIRFISYRIAMAALLFLSGVFQVLGDEAEYHVSLTAQSSSKSLAPYMLGSWNQGRYAEGNGIWQEAGIFKPLEKDRRFSWSAGADYIVGVGEKTDYLRWNGESGKWTTNAVGRNAFRITQLFGEIKYRSVFLTLGMKNSHSPIVDDALSSGDLTRSNNASPIPGIAMGFLDFQNIPFTNRWVQIGGELMYGKMTDSKFKEREFNRFSGLEAVHLWYNYKRCYFRTNPEKPLSVTVGMQAAAMAGGEVNSYAKGELVKTERKKFGIKQILQMFIPREGGEAYYEGSHLGSWDLKAVYRFKDGSCLNAYFEWPWEDGSGIGRMNGWDGLWGLQYNFAKRGIVSKALVEYLDFTNQSGPIHFDPEDHPDNPLTGHAAGADNYYNNDFYGAYTNYGMGIGTPFLVAPLYNVNGMLSYLHNRARGFHAAIEGNPTERISYRLMVGYELAGGTGWVPSFRRSSSTSAMLDCRMQPLRKNPGFEVGVRLALDRGNLRGDNFGAQLQVAYHGDFQLKRR